LSKPPPDLGGKGSGFEVVCATRVAELFVDVILFEGVSFFGPAAFAWLAQFLLQ
jgi:hypothetical protein